MMATTYIKARKTIIWLGEEEDESDAAFLLIRKLDGILTELGKPKMVADMEKDAFTTPHSAAWIALGKLLARRWWSRVWVVQEVTLAAIPELWCGGEREGWNLVGWWAILFSMAFATLRCRKKRGPSLAVPVLGGG
jgi:hypothetical protein